MYFLGVAKHLPGITLLGPVIQELQHLQKGIISFNPGTKEMAIITGSLVIIKGDNPASSELANHAWQSHHPCRVCLYRKNNINEEDSHLPAIL